MKPKVRAELELPLLKAQHQDVVSVFLQHHTRVLLFLCVVTHQATDGSRTTAKHGQIKAKFWTEEETFGPESEDGN